MTFGFIASLAATLLGAILLEIREHGITKNWFLGSRPFIAVHYLFPTVFGIFVGINIFQNAVSYLDIFVLFITIFLSFQTSVVVNDVNDLPTDQISKKKSLLNSSSNQIKHLTALGSYFFIISILFALSISYQMLLIVVLGHALHFIYSSKPFRLKRFYPISIILLCSGALLAAIAGYALFEQHKPFLSFPGKAACFVFIPLFLALNFRDLSDYQGDKQTEIVTLFTIFGLKTGRLINAFLVMMSYFSIPLILGYLPLYWAVVPLGVVSFHYCLRRPFNEKYIFYIYFILVGILTVVFNLNPQIILS